MTDGGANILERCLRVSTCQLSDGLANAGLYPLGLAGIWPMVPCVPFAGWARTVQFKPKDQVRPEDRIEYLEYVKPGDVIVIANGGRIDCSSWGGQRSLGALQAGAVGVVLHGAYRDVDELRRVGLPVYGLGPTVAASRHGGIPVAVDTPITITGCTIDPGDLVVGDSSGVLAIPRSAAEAVVAEAERLTEKERSVYAAVAAGRDYLTYRKSQRGETT